MFSSRIHALYLLLLVILFGNTFQLRLQHAGAFIKEDCWHIDFDHGTSACLCEESLCPEVKDEYSPYDVNSYLTTKSDDRWKHETFMFTELEPRNSINLKIIYNNPSSKQDFYSKVIEGFGGTLNDATINNYHVLPLRLRDKLLDALFDDKIGLGLRYLRVPIGGTDFSTTGYSLADEVPVQNFSLSIEDVHYRIPLIKRIQYTYKNNDIKLIASVWSPPAWLKTNRALVGGGKIRGEPGISWYFYKYAQYIRAFIDHFSKFDLNLDGITFVNVEQNRHQLRRQNSLEMSHVHQDEFRDIDLGKMFRNHQDVNIFINHKNSSLYHGNNFKFYGRDYGKRMSYRPLERVEIGCWSSAEEYSRRIFSAIREGANAVIELSLILNLYGKPNYSGILGRAPIIVHEVESSFFRLPEYYVIGHFSRFVTPGSILLDLQYSKDDMANLEALAFQRPDMKTVVIIHNFREEYVDIVVDSEFGYLYVMLPPKSIRTLLWDFNSNL